MHLIHNVQQLLHTHPTLVDLNRFHLIQYLINVYLWVNIHTTFSSRFIVVFIHYAQSLVLTLLLHISFLLFNEFFCRLVKFCTSIS